MNIIVIGVGILLGAGLGVTGFVLGAKKTARKAISNANRAALALLRDPVIVALAASHMSECPNCRPGYVGALDEVSRRGVPTDHRDPATGQYL